jgi:hypothetical protein
MLVSGILVVYAKQRSKNFICFFYSGVKLRISTTFGDFLLQTFTVNVLFMLDTRGAQIHLLLQLTLNLF